MKIGRPKENFSGEKRTGVPSASLAALNITGISVILDIGIVVHPTLS